MMSALLWTLACFHVYEGNGVQETRARVLGDYTAVSNDSLLRVELGTAEQALTEVTCDSNLLPHIQTRVRGSTLEVYLEEGVHLSTNTNCFVRVEVAQLHRVTNVGSGRVADRSH